MLAAAVIVFREILEAALIVSVVLAALRGVKGARRTVLGGISAGAVGALVLAYAIAHMAELFSGSGQELFGAAILFSVVGLLAWHIVWMQSHGRALVQDMRATCDAVSSGQKSLLVLGTVIALAVLREGAEIVLFMQGMIAAGNATQVFLGFVLGLVAGILAGAVIYWGFAVLPIGKLFSSTNALLMLIAAGMAAKGAGKLIESGYLPPLYENVWDSSAILSEKSLLGEFLGTLVGYMATPSAMQLLFYAITITAIMTLSAHQKKAVARKAS